MAKDSNNTEFFGALNASSEFKTRLRELHDRLRDKRTKDTFTHLESITMVDLIALAVICTRVHYPSRGGKSKYGALPSAIGHIDWWVGTMNELITEADDNLSQYAKNLTSKRGTKDSAMDAVARTSGLMFRSTMISVNSLMGVLSWQNLDFNPKDGPAPNSNNHGGDNLLFMLKTLLEKSILKARHAKE